MGIKTIDIVIGQDEVTVLPGNQFNTTVRSLNNALVENQPIFETTVITDLTNNGLNGYGLENHYTKGLSNIILSRKNTFICSGSNSNYILTTNTALINSKLAVYQEGIEIQFTANHINIGACTINIDGLGVVNLVKQGNIPLSAGDVNGFVVIKYSSGGYFEVISKIASDTGSASQKKFSVNSGSVSVGSPNFITNPDNFNVTISGSITPLVYTYANGNTQEQSTNITKGLRQNGTFIVYKDDTDINFLPTLLNLRVNTVSGHNTLYKPLNQLQNGTANFTNGSNVLNNLIGINTSLLTAGQSITSAITGLATGFLIACNRTNGSAVLTNVNTVLWSSVFVGQVITGTGIPANSRIIAFNNTGVIATSTITLSVNATSTGTQQPTLSANPKITSFTPTTITLDLPCTANTANSAIEIHEDITTATSLNYFKVGMAITGTNIPINSTIQSVNTVNNTITINNNATATGTAINNIQASQIGFYESTTQPTGNDDNLWININPLASYKKVSGLWTAYNFVNLGEVIKSNGIIASPTNYAYNDKYSASTLALAINSQTILIDNIAKLKNIYYELECVVANNNYNVGDRVPRWVDGVTGITDSTIAIVKERLQTRVILGNQGIAIPNKTTNVFVSSVVTNWKMNILVNSTY